MIRINFIFKYSFFIAICAAAMALQTSIIIENSINASSLGLVFFATLAAYNFYSIICIWNKDRKNHFPLIFPKYVLHITFLFLAALAMIDYLWYQKAIIPIVLMLFLLLLIYSSHFILNSTKVIFNRFPIIKSGLLAFTWTIATVLIPLIHLNFFSDVFPFFVLRFIFILMICILFDHRDVQVDEMIDVKDFQLKTKVKFTTLLMISLLIVFNLVLFSVDKINHRQFFVLLFSGVLVYLIYLLSLKKRTFYFYYFIVDGLMLFSSIASYLASI